ncbi:hypothetical protein BDV97DRAFT_137088 [Delphinella strobiligena]|nr:hypothetical protein BDV97DRAFT_137088 [Delphinella strobiligena]
MSSGNFPQITLIFICTLFLSLLLHMSHTNICHVSIGPVGTFSLLSLPSLFCISSPESQPFQCCRPITSIDLLFFDIIKHSMTLPSESLDLATNLDHLLTTCARIHNNHHHSAINTKHHETGRGCLPYSSVTIQERFFWLLFDNARKSVRCRTIESAMYAIISSASSQSSTTASPRESIAS